MSEETSFPGFFFLQKAKANNKYFSATSFYNNADKNSLKYFSSQLAIEVSFAVSLRLRKAVPRSEK